MSEPGPPAAGALDAELPLTAMGVAVPDTRLHPVYLVIETAKTLRSAIPFLVVTILGGAPFWVNAVLFAIVMLIAVAQWHVKKYSVISGVLRLRAGLLNRTVRVVPISRITALDAYRSLSQRLVGVWGLKVQSPGDRNGSAVVLGSLSGRRLDQVRAALQVRAPAATAPDATARGTAHLGAADRAEPGPGATIGADHGPNDSSTLQRYLSWRRSASTATPKRGPDVIAVLRTREMLFAAITNNTIPLIFAVALVTWYRFSDFVPSRAADFMHESVEPRGAVAVMVALIVVAIVLGVVANALRLNQFTLTRDGDVLRNSRGLLGTQSGTIPVARVQAVRIVEGLWRAPFGYCSLQVEVAGLGAANNNRRMLFPLIKTDRARALIGRALPEIRWPAVPLTPLPARIHRRYLTVPMEYGAGFTAAAAVTSRLVAAARRPADADGVPARGAAGAGGAVARRRHGGRAAVAAGAVEEHGDRPPDRRATDGVVEFAVEGQGGGGRVHDALLLRAARADPVHARAGRAAAARDGRPAAGSFRVQRPASGRPVPLTVMSSHPGGRRARFPGRRHGRFARGRFTRGRFAHGRVVAALAAVLALTAGCADFSGEAPSFTVQPSLTARAALPDETSRGPSSSSAPTSPPGSSGAPAPSGTVAPPDPCAPTDEAVIATCLSAPWGLVPMADGSSALVGERTTGRLLQVAKGVDPVLVTTFAGVDAAGDGGLLGIALSPSYEEDGLIYAYITTAKDNRIVRIAKGDVAKPIFTGIPKGTTHNGGRIAFGADRLLYVGTGDTGKPALAADKASLAGKVLRLDEFGKPAESNPIPGSPIFASGFTQVAGMCPMTDGTVAALDRRRGEDVLLPLEAGKNYAKFAAGKALWTWTAADGGAADCSISGGLLANTSLDKQQLTAVQMGSGGSFTGTPTVLLDNRYGRLLTVAADQQGLLWLTTSNKDGKGKPVPSDDRVIVVPSGSSGGDGGPD